MFTNIIIYTHLPFMKRDGGITVQYNLAKILKTYGKNVKICSNEGICDNNIYNEYCDASDYGNNDYKIDNTIVIYCEGIMGNPLNAKYVIRWMLSELGKNVSYDSVNTWGKNELVYYFNSELRFDKYPEKKNIIYKTLTSIYIDDNIKNYNHTRTDYSCYTIRKGYRHHNKIDFIHSNQSTRFEIVDDDNIELIKLFNSHKFFVCYDPLSFLPFISALCGCIPILYKVDNLTKKEWYKTLGVSSYLEFNKLDYLYGIAYGADDVQYAYDTIHLVKKQWDDINKFNIKNTIEPFLKDIDLFEYNKNTIENNYFK